MSVAFPPCPECDGSGVVVKRWTEGLYPRYGVRSSESPCPSCGGRGVLITDELVEAVKEAVMVLGGYVSSQQARASLVAVVEKLKEKPTVSELEKALESIGPLIAGGYGCVVTEDDPIIDAARRQLSLTSPETIEKAAEAIREEATGNLRIALDAHPMNCWDLAVAVLRSVEEGET